MATFLSTLPQPVFWVTSGVLGLGAFLTGVAKLYIDHRLSSRLEAQKSSLRSGLEADLERAKHTLQLEQSRLGIVYENQRDSFTKVIRAMHTAIIEIEERFDYSDEAWRAIDETVRQRFRSVRVTESLYTGRQCDLALQFFQKCLQIVLLTRWTTWTLRAKLFAIEETVSSS